MNVTEKRNKKQRKILLEAARSLLDYLEAAGILDDCEGPLFQRCSPDGRSLLPYPLCRETVWRIVKKYCREVGIPAERLGGEGLAYSLRKSALNNAI